MRVWIGTCRSFEKLRCEERRRADWIATRQTVNVIAGARVTRFQMATLSQANTVTLETTGAVVGDVIKIVPYGHGRAFTLPVVNGGAGAGTLCTLVAFEDRLGAGLLRRHEVDLLTVRRLF